MAKKRIAEVLRLRVEAERMRPYYEAVRATSPEEAIRQLIKEEIELRGYENSREDGNRD